MLLGKLNRLGVGEEEDQPTDPYFQMFGFSIPIERAMNGSPSTSSVVWSITFIVGLLYLHGNRGLGHNWTLPTQEQVPYNHIWVGFPP